MAEKGSSTQRNSTSQIARTESNVRKDNKQQGKLKLTGKQLTSPVRHRRRTAPSRQLDRTDERVHGWREWDGWPWPTHHQKAQSFAEKALVLLPESESSTKKIHL